MAGRGSGAGELIGTAVPRYTPGSSTSAALKMVWLLSVMVTLAGFTFEVLELNNLYPSQRFLLPLLQFAFALWALVEMLILGRREKTIPLTALKVALWGQLAIVAARVILDRTVDSHRLGIHLPLGMATIYVPLYSVALLAISKLLVDAFAFALQSANSELQRLATTDYLTGARNRGFLNDFLAAEHDRAHRNRIPLSLLMIDVDNFKTINDTFGHPAGDRVLVELIRRITDGLRTTDVVARTGGEEFAVVLPQCGLLDAAAVAEKVRRLVGDRPVEPVGEVTVSVGVAQLLASESLESWLGRVDGALYGAKSDGRNRVRLAPE